VGLYLSENTKKVVEDAETVIEDISDLCFIDAYPFC
jgi:hypothetical protein